MILEAGSLGDELNEIGGIWCRQFGGTMWNEDEISRGVHKRNTRPFMEMWNFTGANVLLKRCYMWQLNKVFNLRRLFFFLFGTPGGW
jgi:hypothetical protein